MSWAPINEAELWDKINSACGRMTAEQLRIWDVVKVSPHKWAEDSYGKQGGGFWVVAIVGVYVIWYNDIEGGFNQSTYVEFGTIGDYWCNQDGLEFSVQNIINLFKDGYYSAGRAGPPQTLK